jgi:hypothetical protein
MQFTEFVVHLFKLLTDAFTPLRESVRRVNRAHASRELCTAKYAAVCDAMTNRHCVLSTGRAQWWVVHWFGGAGAASGATLEKLTGGWDGMGWDGMRPLATEIDSLRVQDRLSELFNAVCLKFLLSYSFIFCSFVCFNVFSFFSTSLDYSIPPPVSQFRSDLISLFLFSFRLVQSNWDWTEDLY